MKQMVKSISISGMPLMHWTALGSALLENSALEELSMSVLLRDDAESLLLAPN